MTAHNNNLRYRILINSGLLYASFIWGSTFFLVKNAILNVHPVSLVSYRFIIAAAAIIPFLIFQKKNPFKNILPGFTLGIFMWILYIAQTWGLKFTTAANSGFITGLFVLFVPVFSFITTRKLPPLNKNIAIILSVTGLWILTGGLKNINIGDSLTIIASMTYAWHIMLTDRYAKNDLDPWILSFQQFLTVGILGFITAVFTGAPLSVSSSSAAYIIVFLGLFPSFSAYIIQVYAQKTESPVKVALIFALESPIAAGFAWTLGREQFIWERAMGGFVIFIAMVISEVSLKKNKKIKVENV
jgi:drug/metabolite transporter (DMT)-like permease